MKTGSRPCAGFSLVEAVLALVLLMLITVLAGGFYANGAVAARQQADELVITTLMRDQMERLMATRPAQLTNGNRVVQVNGRNETLGWQIAGIDLDGNGTLEAGVYRITVTLAQRALVTLTVDHQGGVGKL